jgi:4-amino-4-deoxy-L-arabinose transferase-like glycosyltransferase
MAWGVGVALVASLIVATGFASDDPDSALYAGIADRMHHEPVAKWIAPEWWGFWPEAAMTGFFREHPAGIFWAPAALGRLGLPPLQGAYVVGVAAALGALLLIGGLVSRLSSAADGRAALILLQLMPAAFIFRIRANHEYPMLFALTLMLTGLSLVGRSWRFAPLVGGGLVLALLVKGVFVVMLLLVAGLWIVINPTAEARARQRGIIAVGLGVAAMAATAWVYDWQYQRVTGELFWSAYWQRQLGPVTMSTPIEGGSTLLHNLFFYISRLLWHPAPWSFALLAALWAWRRRIREIWSSPPSSVRRGLLLAVAFAVASVALLAPSSRFAERYVFSATYAIGTAGAVLAYQRWPSVRTSINRADAMIPALPAMTWTFLMLARLFLGPYLPRL